ncbi:hypothetical protein SUDANB108_00327 [Streptomyces sp. enrichment culture]|uniref:hypothetical protein n=1 Tax=Streptomyces sp. enrichment culture TaxID=1795815 RepID=UPI003F543279
MPETTTPTTELASQYIAQVTGDLEANVKEQERISAEIASLQEQLASLQHDHGVLVSMRQALGITEAPARTEADAEAGSGTAAVPSPRQRKTGTAAGGKQQARKSATATKTRNTTARKATAKKATAKSTPARKPAAKETAASKETAAAKATAKSAPAKKPAAGKAATVKAAEPTLVELIRRHLAEQKEPRSAAEISSALGQAHPERGVSAKVVRVTLEGLVAKSQAERSKQGRSVFYSAPAGTAAAPAEAGPRPEAEPQPQGADA